MFTLKQKIFIKNNPLFQTNTTFTSKQKFPIPVTDNFPLSHLPPLRTSFLPGFPSSSLSFLLCWNVTFPSLVEPVTMHQFCTNISSGYTVCSERKKHFLLWHNWHFGEIISDGERGNVAYYPDFFLLQMEYSRWNLGAVSLKLLEVNWLLNWYTLYWERNSKILVKWKPGLSLVDMVWH